MNNSLSDNIVRVVKREATTYNITHYSRGEIQTIIESTFCRYTSPWISNLTYDNNDTITIYITVRRNSPMVKVSHDMGMGSAIRSEDFLDIIRSPHRDLQINSILDE